MKAQNISVAFLAVKKQLCTAQALYGWVVVSEQCTALRDTQQAASPSASGTTPCAEFVPAVLPVHLRWPKKDHTASDRLHIAALPSHFQLHRFATSHQHCPWPQNLRQLLRAADFKQASSLPVSPCPFLHQQD